MGKSLAKILKNILSWTRTSIFKKGEVLFEIGRGPLFSKKGRCSLKMGKSLAKISKSPRVYALYSFGN
jgi:hypothetical protein